MLSLQWPHFCSQYAPLIWRHFPPSKVHGRIFRREMEEFLKICPVTTGIFNSSAFWAQETGYQGIPLPSPFPLLCWVQLLPLSWLVAHLDVALFKGSPSLSNLVAWILGWYLEGRTHCFFKLQLCLQITLSPPWRADLNSQLPGSFLEPHFWSLNSAPGWPRAVCFIFFHSTTRKASLECAIMKSSEQLLMLTSDDFLHAHHLSGYPLLQGRNTGGGFGIC